MTLDPNHAANIHKIAPKLANVLIAHGSAPWSNAAADLPDLGWAMVATLAADDEWEPKVGYVPSAETRTATVSILRFQERLNLEADADPFRGLPS